MKKILIVVPRLIGHGMERMAVLAAKVLSDKYDTEIIVFTDKDVQYETSIPLINLNVPAVDSKIGKGVNVIRRVKQLARYRKKVKPYAVISFGTSANIANALSKGCGYTIISFRGYATVAKGASCFLTCKLSDWIFCISEGLVNHLVELYPWTKEKTSVIYNCIDRDAISMASTDFVEYTPDTPAFVAVGRLEPVKGYNHLLNAYYIVQKAIPSASMTFIGEGSERENLQKKAEELGISDKVCFLGSHENPFPYVKRCDICVGTSITEGFMNVLVEAGACGVPVISVDCPSGPREILSELRPTHPLTKIEYADYGILVPAFISPESNEPEKEKLLAEAMIKLATDQTLYQKYKKAIWNRTNRFTIDNYRYNLTELLESRLQNGE